MGEFLLKLFKEGFWPVKNSFDFVLSHAESVRGENESEVFHGVFVELTFARSSIESISMESAKDFLDMSLVLGHVVGIDEDVVEVYNDTNIQHVAEDVVHKVLKSSGPIGKSKQNNQPFKQAIVSVEGGFPFITISYVEEVVGMA
jgi:hypothetical protein